MPMNFERSELTETVVKLLRQVNGESSYEALAKQAGVSQTRLKAVLGSARRILRKEKIMFGSIVGVGVKRLVDTDIVRKSEHNKKRLSRAAKRGIKELEAIHSFDQLSGADQITVTTNRTIFNLTRSQMGGK